MVSNYSEKEPLLPTTNRPPPARPPRIALTVATTTILSSAAKLTAIALLFTFYYLSTCHSTTTLVSSTSSSLDAYIYSQEKRSFKGVMANVGTRGSYSGSEGAKAGVVIASPSTSAPNYLYTWTRDAALVSKALLDKMLSTGNYSLAQVLKEYSEAQSILQHVDNPSGTFNSGGLGEPKFNVDLTAFVENWGRPQRDGPALRATTLIGYANYLKTAGDVDTVLQTLAPMIEADLDYVVTYWGSTGFDLWEEVKGMSFFTSLVQYRALREGAAFFASLGSPRSRYSTAADGVLCFLQSYWSEKDQYILSNTHIEQHRSGLDGNSILGSIHTFDSESLTCDPTTFQPCSDRALANHLAVVDSFRDIYPINDGISRSAAVAVGRYKEDVYFDGQPWYLITLAAAEQLYDALWTWDHAGHLNITEVSLPFFKRQYPAAAVGMYSSKSAAYKEITQNLRNYADGFFAVVQKFTPEDGAFAEQFHRKTGAPLSAADLTWSYASFVTATAARRGDMPKSWNSAGSGTAVCSGEGSTTGVLVKFEEIVKTSFGENVHVVGSLPELGSWDPTAARLMSSSAYTDSNNAWTLSMYLPPATSFEFKFIRIQKDGSVKWESGPNHSLTTANIGESTTSQTNWQ
ncbi:glucoamylase [Meredithblackwellia eburnea MCA 4105]